ncbi:MAG TPA: hypothetical protein PKH47_15245, partial [Anaerolineales bacterium]|nr:hypothetical protein [Anaerolineales bacterium]
FWAFQHRSILAHSFCHSLKREELMNVCKNLFAQRATLKPSREKLNISVNSVALCAPNRYSLEPWDIALCSHSLQN